MNTVGELIKQHSHPKQRAWVEGDEVVLDAGAYKYRFALDRCDTPEKVLSWCLHLSQKTWATRPLIRDFIRLAHEINSVPIDFNA